MTEQTIDAPRICDYLDQFSQELKRPTVVVLDNASLNQGEIKKWRASWEAKGLCLLFFLSPVVLTAVEHR